MLKEVENILNMTIIKASVVGALFVGEDAEKFLTDNAKNIGANDLDCAYKVILEHSSRSLIQIYVILCSLAHIYVYGDKSDYFVAKEFGTFEASTDRFLADKSFALLLLRSYLEFYSRIDKPELGDYAKSLGLYIGIDEVKEKPVEEVVTVDELLLRAFDDIKVTLSSIDTGDKLVSSIVNFIHYGSAASDNNTKNNIVFLNRNYSLFLRMMYAKVFASVLSGVVILDGDFQKEFDSHLVSKNYTAAGDYEKKLMAYFITARERENDIVLDDDRVKLVRGIFALYR